MQNSASFQDTISSSSASAPQTAQRYQIMTGGSEWMKLYTAFTVNPIYVSVSVSIFVSVSVSVSISVFLEEAPLMPLGTAGGWERDTNMNDF